MSREKPSVMTKQEFVQTFGPIYEHSAWIAERAWNLGLAARHDTLDGLFEILSAVVVDAAQDQQLALIRAHPDLAGKAARRGELTSESKGEQAGAGIDQCSGKEFASFEQYNAAYKHRFGFPFVMAVKGSDKNKILAAFEQRLDNDYDTEFNRALNEVNKIARLRLAEIL